MIWVYVAGPYSSDHVRGTRDAVDMGTLLLEHGFTPIVPHLTMFWDFVAELPYERWIAYDLELLQRCDALIRLPGESRGADIEVETALELGLPVFGDIEAVLDCYGEKG